VSHDEDDFGGKIQNSIPTTTIVSSEVDLEEDEPCETTRDEDAVGHSNEKLSASNESVQVCDDFADINVDDTCCQVSGFDCLNEDNLLKCEEGSCVCQKLFCSDHMVPGIKQCVNCYYSSDEPSAWILNATTKQRKFFINERNRLRCTYLLDEAAPHLYMLTAQHTQRKWIGRGGVLAGSLSGLENKIQGYTKTVTFEYTRNDNTRYEMVAGDKFMLTKIGEECQQSLIFMGK